MHGHARALYIRRREEKFVCHNVGGFAVQHQTHVLVVAVKKHHIATLAALVSAVLQFNFL